MTTPNSLLKNKYALLSEDYNRLIQDHMLLRQELEKLQENFKLLAVLKLERALNREFDLMYAKKSRGRVKNR